MNANLCSNCTHNKHGRCTAPGAEGATLLEHGRPVQSCSEHRRKGDRKRMLVDEVGRLDQG